MSLSPDIPENHEYRKTNPHLLSEEHTKNEWLVILEQKSEEDFPTSPKHIARSLYHADVLRRRNIFIEKFSINDIPVDGNVILTAKEAYSMEDFQVNVRFEFIRYVNGIDDIVHRGDKRKWANNSLEELHLKHNRWDYLPIITIWSMLSNKKPHYKHYVMWLLGEVNSNMTNKFLENAIKYGSFDLFLAILGVILSNNATKVNLVSKYKTFLEMSAMWHNLATFRVLEILNLDEEPINHSHYLQLACVSSSDTGDEMTEYLVSKLTSFDNLECFKHLTANKQWRRVKFLQDTLNKHNLFINSEDLKKFVFSLSSELGVKVEGIQK